jgi:hypothetical protein
VIAWVWRGVVRRQDADEHAGCIRETVDEIEGDRR